MSALAPYWAVLSVRFRQVSQYRAAALAGVLTQLAFGFIIYMSLDAFVRTHPERSPMNQSELLAYVWLGQAFFVLLPWSIDKELIDSVKTGTIAYEMARPVDVYWWWYFRSLGARTCGALLRCVPVLLVVGPVFEVMGVDEYALGLPPSIEAMFGFSCALFLSVLMGTAITVLMEVTILWTLSVEGVKGFFPAVITMLSGAIVPLPMFPDWARRVIDVLPFRGLIDVPFRAYSGSLEPALVLRACASSALWTLVVIALGRLVMARGLKRVVVHGG